MTKRRPNKRKRSAVRKIVTGVAWYDAEQWAKLKQVATDPERLENTYEEWQQMFAAALKKLILAGIAPVRILLNADEFLRWCQSKGRLPDGQARAEFVAEKVLKID